MVTQERKFRTELGLRLARISLVSKKAVSAAFLILFSSEESKEPGWHPGLFKYLIFNGTIFLIVFD